MTDPEPDFLTGLYALRSAANTLKWQADRSHRLVSAVTLATVSEEITQEIERLQNSDNAQADGGRTQSQT